jgi:hypothetical protein
MDPLTTYTTMVSCFLNNELFEAKDYALDLLNWFGKGGFYPKIENIPNEEIFRLTKIISLLDSTYPD